MSQRALPRSRSRTGLVAVLVTVVVLGLATAVILPLRERSKIPFLPPSTRCQATLDDGRTATLDLEQARNASLIAGIATSRYLEPRATSIALATAFQESDIRNLDYGDLDSLGIFQQRPAAGWGTPEEIMDPYYSTNAFFDALVKLADWQTADIGVIAQEIQRSAYPDAYDKHVDRARILASVLTGETAAGWTCHVRDPAAADPA
ncbi:MAG: hypothetical protein LBR33_06525, partial [Propionibacteriaceae bacterium]|nr:hypothetical protein [Propionibacteriaceae bacterium]